MRVVIDIEGNALENVSQIWLAVCKDIDTGQLYIFRNLTKDETEKQRFIEFSQQVTLWIGHNFLGYDYPVLSSLLDWHVEGIADISCDTLIVSKLIDYSRAGHSIEDYGLEFGFPKGFETGDGSVLESKHFPIWFYQKYSEDLENYCVRDVEICERIYRKYSRYINDLSRLRSILLEHRFQLVVNDLHDNGFAFNVEKAKKLLDKVEAELKVLDDQIEDAFPPKEVLIREFTPKATKFGTISKTSIPRSLHDQIHLYEVGNTYRHTKTVDFNPSSHKQLISVLTEAGWSPVDKTTTHIQLDRELNKLKFTRNRTGELDTRLQECHNKKLELEKHGWKINETNLATLPEDAPSPARLLAQRILLEARRRTLVEWLSLVHLEVCLKKGTITICGGDRIIVDVSTTSNKTMELRSKTIIEWLKSKKLNVFFVKENAHSLWITITPPVKSEGYSAEDAIRVLDGLSEIGLQYKITSERIKGRYYGLGAWTHRMAHQKPNTANIPTDAKLFGHEMRSLWRAPRNRLLIGVDAEGIQLRIFAHYINDPEFIDALVRGKKDDKSDPHSLNQRILGAKSRNHAKRFIFAYLLGAGIGKLAQILEVPEAEGRAALDRLVERYAGLQHLKQTIIPADAKRGWFTGIDGRGVKIPGDTEGQRKHLCMSGYLQSGEAIVMKAATIKWYNSLKYLGQDHPKLRWSLVNLVHDEWQTEVNNDFQLAKLVAETQANSLKLVGEELNLNCPLAGSYWNDDAKDFTIGTNWSQTH